MRREKIREGWDKIKEQLKDAEEFLKKNKTDEALYFIWIVAENLVNSLKTTLNGFYLKEHREKTYILKDYFVLGILKKDYSDLFKKLSKYRIAAGFHPYTSIPKNYTKQEVIKFLEKIKELKGEVERILIKRGVLK
ncbi:MAG: hypothetical protein DRP06_03755 [Candidatus Aenigmatarchaeota archaeon]|nr:MAG: hypothetical protein DRP06_03755 [Candidatus Aenigmarchaeota archaeon]